LLTYVTPAALQRAGVENADFRGQRSAAQDHVGNAFITEKGFSEFATRDLTDPCEVLHDQRIAQPEFLHEMRAVGLAQLGETLRTENCGQRIARHDTHHQKDDDGNTHDCNRAKGETAEDIRIHGREDY
jgi:hypothetical protein